MRQTGKKKIQLVVLRESYYEHSQEKFKTKLNLLRKKIFKRMN